MGTGRRGFEPRPLFAELQPSPPCPLLFQLLLPALARVAGCCGVSWQHPREVGELLCLPAACSQAWGGAPHCLIRNPPLQGCSEPAALAAPEGVLQGAQHTVHIAAGRVAAHEADSQDLGGEGRASPCSTHFCSHALVPPPFEQSGGQQSAGSRTEQGVCEEWPCARLGVSACAQLPA